ncbi:hypothetical protein SCUCBS95973_002417 [Sporothrix curviconia]|uniref:Sodium/calcium exchanger membrane region domain-containing protein n=1 Tax=Sporothrix curviconia TaxID=1260050 RepID=A0ABP0B6M9_9PEZI
MDPHAGRTFDSSSNDDGDDDNDGDIYRDSIALDDTDAHGVAQRRPGMAHSRGFASASDVGIGVGSSGGGAGASSAGVGGVPLGAGGTVRRILRFFVRALSRRGHASYRELSSLGSGGHMLPLSDDDVDVDGDVDFADEVATSCMDSFRRMLFSSWLNALLVFVPIGMVTYMTHMKPIAVFATNAIAVIPLSSLLTAATERVASDAGDTVGALLNISLGNLVELILFIVALVNNQVRVVQASILGSILVNSLLILGTALLATGLTDNEPVYNTAETQLLSCLLFASVFVFLMPTAFGYTFDHTKQASKATLQMSRVSSLMVLLIYLIYFVHELRARPIAAKTSATANAGDDSDDSEYDSERGLITPTMPTTPTTPTAPSGPSGLSSATSSAVAPVVLVSSFSAPSLSSSSSSTVECRQVTSASGVSNNSTVPQTRSVRFAKEPLSSRAIPRPDSTTNGGIEMDRMDGFDAPPARTHTRMHSHSHSRSHSADSMRPARRSRASSLSGGGIGGGGGGGGGSSSGNLVGLSSVGGPGGFSGLGGPGLMRSGLTALHIMRDNQQAQAQQQAQRTSLESSASASDHAVLLLGGDPLLPASLSLGGVGHGRRKRPRGEFVMAVIVLIVASALMSVNAEFLVDTIDDVTHQGHLSESVIGLIILPIVGNIAEYVTVVSVALRDKLDLAISVAIGSSIQIALCVTPLTVGAGWILNRNLSLTFSFFEMAALVGTALLVGLLVSSNGDSKLRTCGLKGALMCACYVIIGLGAYLSPNVDL